MKVFVYGKNSDDKGTQLEVLTSVILKNMGYTISRNEISSGGNELDVVATKKEPYGGETRLICECKAYNSLISMNEWLKFIGKLHLEQRKNQMTHGLMIALSGANGYVLGSYNDIKNDNYITLITNKDIYDYISATHVLLPEKEVSEIIGNYTRKNIVDVNLIFYCNSFYWHICFPNGEYTILNNDLSNIDDESLAAFKEMIESQTDSRLYIDIRKEQEAVQRRSYIRSLVLSYTMDEDHTIQEIVDWINKVKDGLNVTRVEVEECINAIPYLKIADNAKVSLIDKKEIDYIEFYRFLLQDVVSVRVMVTKFYKSHINKTLLKKIKQIQCDIQIPEKNVEECLFLLKHSPSALTYAINEDKAITRYRSKGKAISPSVEKAHTEWFLDNVMRSFIADYNNSSLTEYYLDMEKIPSIEMHTNLRIFKEGEDPIEIHHFKAELIGHLGEEYNNKAILMVKIPE
jgi:hypothetical protein